MTVVDEILVRKLGITAYAAALEAMRAFTSRRNEETPDELWIVEHPPVYTLGQRGGAVLRKPTSIPVVPSDRGGDITYHGPGQVVIYTLVDLARRAIQVRQFVALLEQALIDTIGEGAVRRPGAPGVYVAGAKIAALGIRVRRGCAYHGLALNVDMDLGPFEAIDPCGYPGLAVTQTRDIGIDLSVDEIGNKVSALLIERLTHA